MSKKNKSPKSEVYVSCDSWFCEVSDTMYTMPRMATLNPCCRPEMEAGQPTEQQQSKAEAGGSLFVLDYSPQKGSKKKLARVKALKYIHFKDSPRS